MTVPRPLLAAAALALAAAPALAGPSHGGGSAGQGGPLSGPSPVATVDPDSPVPGGEPMPTAKGGGTGWIPTRAPVIPSPAAPTSGTTSGGGAPSGGAAPTGGQTPNPYGGGTGGTPAPAPDAGTGLGAPTDLGGSAPAAPQPTLVPQTTQPQPQPPTTASGASGTGSGGSGSGGSGSGGSGSSGSGSGGDLTSTINSLAGQLGKLMGSRPDTSAFNGVPRIVAPPPTGHRLAGDGEGGAGASGRSLSAPDDARGSQQQPAGADAAREKMVGEIAGLPDSRTAAQKQSAAALQRAKTQMTLEKDFPGALQSLDKAVRFDPDNIEAYLRRAEAEIKLKRYDDALADAKEAIRRDPKNAAAWDEAAWANFKAGRYQDAIEAATRALFLNPNDAVALAIRARARWATGDKAGGLADALAAARLDARFAKLAEAMAKGVYVDDGELLADDAAQVPLQHSLPWTLLLGMAALLFAGLGVLAAFLTRKRRAARVRTFSSLARQSNGRLAGKYELKSILGKGGMGSVHEAFDHTLKRTVAVKKMAEGLTEVNPKAKELLVREAQTVAALRHPNIVDIYEIIDEAGDLYLVFELLRGKTVSQLLAEKGALPLERCAEILKPVCQALQSAHKQELVHRDLKPGNIMLTDDGFVKLMDFGIARQTGAAPVEPGRTAASEREIPLLARTKMVMGTPRYMAPEMDYGVVSKPGDVYALGVCLYEMLTGRFPFETADEKLELRFTPPSRLVPGLTTRVDALLREALDPDPARRIRTPMIFYGRLYAALQPGETPPSPIAAR